jgi:hypothetical protein
VVVAPLAEQVGAAIGTCGGEVLFREATTQHVVFHYAGRREGAGEDRVEEEAGWGAFVRREADYQLGPWSYRLTTVYGIPDFDTPSYGDQIAGDLLGSSGVPRADSWFVWNPGQGHLVTAIAHSKPGRNSQFTLAGRDLLSLQVSRRNLAAAGVDSDRVSLLHRPFVQDCEERVQAVLYAPNDDPGYLWQGDLLASADRLLAPEGRLVVVARSTDAHRLVAKKEGWSILDDARERGCRVLVLGRARSRPH